MEWLAAALQTMWSLVESAFTFMTGNAYFGVLLAIGLVLPVFRIIKKAKKTAVK